MISYGIHTDNHNIRWMYQGSVYTNFVGLKTDPPFKMPKAAKGCPHNIPFSKMPIRHTHWHRFTTMAKNDELARLHLPTLKEDDEPTYWVDYVPGIELHLSVLSRICSPVERVIHPMWTMTAGKLNRELTRTNIQPLVITGVKSSHRRQLKEWVDLARVSRRRLILVTEEEVLLPVAGTKTVTTDTSHTEEMVSYPLENLGAMFLRNYCQNKSIEAILDAKTATA